MPHSSPIMKTSLELFRHAIEHYVSDSDSDRRIAVLHLSHALELAVKACLVNNNYSIFAEGNNTLSFRQCLVKLKKVWNLSDDNQIPYRARIELLADERNGIQHRYGTVDPRTMQHHMETSYLFFKEVMKREYSTNLDEFLVDYLPGDVAKKFAFIGQKDTTIFHQLTDKAHSKPTEAFLEAYSYIETIIINFAAARYVNYYQLNVNEILSNFLDRMGRGSEEYSLMLTDIYNTLEGIVHVDEKLNKKDAVKEIGLVKKVVTVISKNEDILDLAIKDCFKSRGDADAV